MYAVIADSGRQYWVREGDKVLVDFRAKAEPGQTIEFDRVLLVGGAEGGATVGRPVVAGAKVVGSVLRHSRGPKVHIGVYKRRKNFRRHRGHRQTMTEVSIQQIISAS